MIASEAPEQQPIPDKKQELIAQPFDLTGFQPTSHTSVYVADLSSHFIKSPEGYSSMSFLRDHPPTWLEGAVITNDKLVLTPTHNNHRIKCMVKEAPQAVLLPGRELVTKSLTMHFDPANGLDKFLQTLPNYAARIKKAKPRQAKREMMEAYTKNRQMKSLRRRLIYLNKKRLERKKEADEKHKQEE